MPAVETLTHKANASRLQCLIGEVNPSTDTVRLHESGLPQPQQDLTAREMPINIWNADIAGIAAGTLDVSVVLPPNRPMARSMTPEIPQANIDAFKKGITNGEFKVGKEVSKQATVYSISRGEQPPITHVVPARGRRAA